jgi:hypothetical protein
VPTVRLVSWNDDDAQRRARELKALGFKVEARPLGECGGVVGHFRDLAPDAVVLDLDRLPSHGREVGTILRDSKSTRHLPLVFAGGAEEKVERIRAELPDAVFTAWEGIGDAVRVAIAHPVANPVKARSHADRSAATPLLQKLGIKTGMQAAVLGGFEGFEELLGELPAGAARARGRLRPCGGAAAGVGVVLDHLSQTDKAASQPDEESEDELQRK